MDERREYAQKERFWWYRSRKLPHSGQSGHRCAEPFSIVLLFTSHQSHSYTFWTLSTLPAFAGDIAVQDCSGGSALALRELFRSPVRHGRHYNKTILDILDIPIQSSLTTEFTENSLFHHEVHEGKTKGLKQRKPVVSECMRRNRINPLTTCILFMNFMVKLPFLILHILSIPVKPSCFPSAPICGSFRDFREPLNTTVYQSS